MSDRPRWWTEPRTEAGKEWVALMFFTGAIDSNGEPQEVVIALYRPQYRHMAERAAERENWMVENRYKSVVDIYGGRTVRVLAPGIEGSNEADQGTPQAG